MAYRWSFERRWSDQPALCWIGLNPGTGDTENRARPTLRKVVQWALDWNLGGVVVVNLFAYRSRDAKALRAAARASVDIVGDPKNTEVIRSAVANSGLVLAAWGAHGGLLSRGAQVAKLFPNLVCLGTTSGGEPAHPLYIAQATAHTPYRRPQ